LRTILVFLLIIGFGIAGCQRVADMPDSTGTFEATVVEVSCVEPGQIISLPVVEGQELQQGDTIAVIDTTRLAIERASTQVSLRELVLLREQADSKLELAEIQYEATEREFKRAKNLYEKASISSFDFDQHQTQFDVAKNTLQSARIARNELDFKEQLLREKLRLVQKRLDDAIICAPISGTVVEKYHETGEVLGLGGSIVSLADLRHMYAHIYIPETKLGDVKLRQTIRLRIDSHPTQDFQGTLAWISPEAEFTPKNVQTREARVELVYAAKVTIENPDGIFKIGMPVEAYLK